MLNKTEQKQFEAKVQDELEKRLATTSQEGVAIATEAAPQTDETVEEVVENVEVPHASIANNNEASSTEESLSDQFRRAFNT